MKLKNSLLFYSVILISLSCKKQTKENTDTGTITITGTIKLPNGMPQSTSGFNVNSFYTEQTLTDNNYQITVQKNEFNIQFLSNQVGKNILLNLSYPGQTDFTIDSKSTLLALIFKLPALNSLTKDGKINFINKLRISPKYLDALNELELHIKADKDVLDTSNSVLNQKLGLLFDDASQRRSGFGVNGQVYINRANRNIIFGNPGVSCSQVIGIYSNNQRIQKIELDRYKFFTTSVIDILTAIGNPPNPIEASYAFPQDGIYQIKVRNGGFNPITNDLESDEAIVLNGINIVLDNIKTFLPIDVSSGCPSVIYNIIKSKVDAVKNLMKASTDKNKYYNAIYEATKASLYEILIGSSCTPIESKGVRYTEKIIKYIKWLDIVGKTGTFMNNALLTTDLFFNTKSSLDTTIIVGNIPTVIDIDGNSYNLSQIGNKIWTTRNLEVTKYKNGDPIPQVTDPIQWSNLTTGAWCYYSNNSSQGATYGKLYNWYAVNDPRGLAPSGTHIPTDAEWTELTSFLGGETVAGGKMKSTSNLWNLPNLGATNQSGFTALPSGFRNEDGTYGSIGTSSPWWSYTPWSSDLALGIAVYHNQIYSQRYFNYKKEGYGIRLIKD